MWLPPTREFTERGTYVISVDYFIQTHGCLQTWIMQVTASSNLKTLGRTSIFVVPY